MHIFTSFLIAVPIAVLLAAIMALVYVPDFLAMPFAPPEHEVRWRLIGMAISAAVILACLWVVSHMMDGLGI